MFLNLDTEQGRTDGVPTGNFLEIFPEYQISRLALLCKVDTVMISMS